MNKQYKASVVLVSLVILSSLVIIIFINKEKVLEREIMSHFYFERYINQKAKDYLYIKEDLTQDLDEKCDDTASSLRKLGEYNHYCYCRSLFKIKPPSLVKYVSFTNIEDFLDIRNNDNKVYHIKSLSELPESSIENPKVVRALNPINERLLKDFYGIIITDYPFDFRGRKIYGLLYSSYYNNEKERRNLVNNKKVVNNLHNQCWHWFYLPNSKHYLSNEKKN